MQDLVVLIVSYRRADLLARCLASVRRWLPEAPVHVWDNASEGSGAVRDLARAHADVDWVPAASNVGFARAVNGLAARTTAGHLLLLNPDAELLGPLTRTRAVLTSGPRTAAAAPLSQDGVGSASWANAHRPPTLVRQLTSYAGYADRLRHARLSELYGAPPEGPVGYLTGSCLLVHRDAWNEVGPFDERYFLYAEEVDWATRARAAGWALRLVPEIGFRHVAGGTVADDAVQAGRSAQLLKQSQLRYLRDHHGLMAAGLYSCGTTVLDRVQRSKRATSARHQRRDQP